MCYVESERLRPKTGLMALEMILYIRRELLYNIFTPRLPMLHIYTIRTHPHPYLNSLNLFSS